MIVSTFNVRGLGGRVKKSKIRELVRQNNVDFLAVQETKLEAITSNLCYSLCGGQYRDWVFRSSEGNSGGILSIWRKSSGIVLFSFQGEGYVGVCLEWGVEKTRCFVINVYSKCDLESKKRLWESLFQEHRSRGKGHGVWWGILMLCVGGMRGGGVNEGATSSQLLEMDLFNCFINEVELEDLNVLGRRFTWYHPNGRSMSIIDRMLISDERFYVWGDNTLWVLPRDVSDHCPLVLKNGGWDWGPKPFCFNNFWLQNRNFKGVVEEGWRNQTVGGWMSFVLK